MHRPLLDTRQQRILRLMESEAVPAHVGHLHAIGQHGRKRHHLTGDQPQTLMAAVFVAFVKEQLHTKADPKVGDLMLTGVFCCQDHAFNAPAAKAAGKHAFFISGQGIALKIAENMIQ